jgi:hypothetical protein
MLPGTLVRSRERRGPLVRARALPGTLVLSAALLAGRAGAAQGGSAEELFIEGRDALKRGDQAAACAKFRASLALARVANTLFNVSQCDERDGKLTAALQKWREGVLLLGSGDERLSVAKERLGALEARVPRVTFTRAPDLPEGAVLLADGAKAALPASGESLPFDPGDHVIVVDAPGRMPRRFEVTLAERDRKELALAPGEAASSKGAGPTATAAPTGTPPPPSPSDARRTAAFVTAGVGLAGLAVFGITGGLVLERDGRIREACPQKACSPDGRALIDGSPPLLVANAVGLGAGIAGLGAAAVLFLTSGGRGGGGEGAPKVAVAPAVSPAGGGLSVTGSF